MSLSNVLTNLSQASLLCFRVIFLTIVRSFFILYSTPFFVLKILPVASSLFFYCLFYFVHFRSHFPFFNFLYPLLYFLALVTASLIFNQSVSISPVKDVSFPVSLCLYKVLIESCSNRCTLSAAGFLYIVLPVLLYLCFACVRNLNLLSTNLWSLSVSLLLKTLVSSMLLFSLSFIIM